MALIATLSVAVLVNAQISVGSCSGELSDGRCFTDRSRAGCTGVPGDPNYDVDCFTCSVFASPIPAPIVADVVHQGINRMGEMFEDGVYDDNVMRSVALAYFDQRYWDRPVHWGAVALDGYVVYAVARTALEFRDEVESHPTTLKAVECLLHDHASRPIPVTDPPAPGTRAFHGSVPDEWDTRSEDYMSFAVGCAGADAWLHSRYGGSYGRLYLDRVEDAVAQAFTIREEPPHALRRDADPPVGSPTRPTEPSSDVVVGDIVLRTLLRNHDSVSPVYATAIIRHIGHLNTIYSEVGLGPMYDATNRPAALAPLHSWVVSKIGPWYPGSPVYVYRDGACIDRWGDFGPCDDRTVDPREPAHYPLASILEDLGINYHLEYFSAPCTQIGQVYEQAPHNYYYNCLW